MDLDTPLTLLVICPANFAPQLAVAVNAAAHKFQKSVGSRFVNAKFVEPSETLLSFHGTRADFVVVVVDSHVANQSTEVRRLLLTMMTTFSNARMILLNGSCRSGDRATAGELIDVADQFRIPWMNTEIADDNSCKVVAEKMIKLASRVCGYETGVPVMIPAVEDFFPS